MGPGIIMILFIFMLLIPVGVIIAYYFTGRATKKGWDIVYGPEDYE